MPSDDELLEELEDDTPVLKQLRQRFKDTSGENKALKAQARELAFLKAGVDVETKAGKLLMKSYDGDLSDIEALQTEAKELGVYKGPATPGEVTQQQAVQPGGRVNLEPQNTGSQIRQELAGGVTPDPNKTDPREDARQVFEMGMKDNLSWEDAAALWVSSKATRAAKDAGQI
jgi:hypothetical protein